MPTPFDRLPDSVVIDGIAYPIDTDYRLGVELEMAAVCDTATDYAEILRRFYRGRMPVNVSGAADKMIWFFGGGDESPPNAFNEGKKPARIYDYAQDADVISASFRAAYGIDLNAATLHWWAFRRLLLNLPDDCTFKQRIHYRCVDLKTLDKTRRKAYRKLKEMYAIKAPQKRAKTVEEAEAEMLARVNRAYERAQKAAENQTERGG